MDDIMGHTTDRDLKMLESLGFTDPDEQKMALHIIRDSFTLLKMRGHNLTKEQVVHIMGTHLRNIATFAG